MSDTFPEVSPKGAYVSTANFATAIYSYTVSLNDKLETVGTLANITKLPDNVTVLVGSSYACPANRILNLTGKKLLPGRDVITVNTTSPATTATFFVGVLDPVTGLNGFIDPTSTLFSKYTNDAVILNDGTKPFNASQSFGGTLPGTGVGTKLTISGSGTFAAPLTGTTIVSGVATVPAAAGSASVGMLRFPNSCFTMTVNTTAVTANSIIMLTPQNGIQPAATPNSIILFPVVSSRVAGTSFTVSLYTYNTLSTDVASSTAASPAVNPIIGWFIVN